jgi:hypothetical protein
MRLTYHRRCDAIGKFRKRSPISSPPYVLPRFGRGEFGWIYASFAPDPEGPDICSLDPLVWDEPTETSENVYGGGLSKEDWKGNKRGIMLKR